MSSLTNIELSTVLFNIFLVSIREPGKEWFKIVHVAENKNNIGYFEVGTTIDKANSKRCIHLVGMAEGRKLCYKRSSDNGLTWSNDTVIANDLAINNEAEEGAIYAVVSKDHGKTFTKPILINHSRYYWITVRALDLCGLNGKKLLFSGSSDYYYEHPHLRYLPSGSQHFLDLPFPFKKFRQGTFVNPTVACR
eukprot:TRINITY_DN3421_c0_g1_i8.p1 TRINITY_DN3421_c0_g1~~TRINITY_DN3421_c0_g1_i8.p1  ORF type:complete len:193 (+),score=19.36 TRINITY_DN3421_c0_g1_i8:524-1102(+)